MRWEYFGDSYDVVKQSLLRWLTAFGPWAVHPMFTGSVSPEDAATLGSFLGVPILSTECLTPMSDRRAYLARAFSCRSHLLLDPDTGLKLKMIRGKKAPLYLFAEELRDIVASRRKYLTLVFDQSLPFAKRHESLLAKLGALYRDFHLCSLAYESHACFVLASAEDSLVREAGLILTRESGLPARRILWRPQSTDSMHPAHESGGQ